jgi:hypothetical protein
MKKFLALMMALILSVSLIACGGEEITLQSQTVNGLTFDVPSDFGEFNDIADQIKMAVNEDSTATITLSERVDAQGITADLWDKETFIEAALSGMGDVQVLEFSNTASAVGSPAVFSHYTAINASDAPVEGYMYFIYYNDGTYQSIAFSFNKDGNSSLKQNINAIMDSLK